MGITDKIKDALGAKTHQDRTDTDAGLDITTAQAADGNTGAGGDGTRQATGKAGGPTGAAGGKARELVENVGDQIDGRTGGKFAGHVDEAQRKAAEIIDKRSRNS